MHDAGKLLLRFFRLLTLNMARQGYFGDLVHVEGAYIHNLMELNFSKTGYQDMWRLKENATRKAAFILRMV